MKTIIFLCISIACAFAFDSVFGYITGGIIPPLTVITVFYWFWRFEIGQRLVWSMISGAILETTGFLPSGTYMIMFVFAAFLCVPMKNFFSNTKSHPVVVLNVMILTIAFRLLSAPASSLLQFLASLT